LPAKPMTKGSSWEARDEQPIVEEPLSLTASQRMWGTWKLHATEAITHMGRRCARLSMKGEWSRAWEEEQIEVTANGSGSAIVDLATGVMFSYSSKIKQTAKAKESRNVDSKTQAETTATVTYIGGKELYDQYKAKQAPEG